MVCLLMVLSIMKPGLLRYYCTCTFNLPERQTGATDLTPIRLRKRHSPRRPARHVRFRAPVPRALPVLRHGALQDLHAGAEELADARTRLCVLFPERRIFLAQHLEPAHSAVVQELQHAPAQ